MNSLLRLAFLFTIVSANNLYAQDDVYNRDPKDTLLVLIPFEYKQSALFHSYTKEVIDSVAYVMLKNPAIKVSIDGYSHALEGSDTICYYISLNRALFVKDYLLGRGIDSSRLLWVIGYGRTRPNYRGLDKKGAKLSCRAELILHYPPPIVRPIKPDRDGDGFFDVEDQCPDVYGHDDKNGCPDSAIVVPFGDQYTGLYSAAYLVMDSVVRVLKENPAYTLSISGHAHEEEGNPKVCEKMANSRADIVKAYLLSRYIAGSRIDIVKSMGTTRPLNAGRNPLEKALNARTEIFLNRHLALE